MAKKRSHGDGALYTIRGGKLWRGVIDGGYDENQKRIQYYVHARTKTLCRDKLKALQAEIEEHGAPIDKTIKVSEWGDRWLEDSVKPNVDPSTYRGYRSALTQRILPVLGRKRVSAIKPSDIHAVLALGREQGRSASVLRTTYVAMNQLFEAARVEGLCAKNPVADVRKPQQRTARREAFTTEQALAILKAASELPNWEGSRWWFKLLAGPRQTELLGAEISQFLPDLGIYDLAWKLEELSRDHGCGSQDSDGSWPCGYKRGANCPSAVWAVPDGFEKRHLEGRWHLTRPKSGNARAIPIIPQLSLAITEHLKATEHQPNPHGLIWHNPDGSLIEPRQDDQEWRNLLHQAGIIGADQLGTRGTQLTGHIARHTTVTVLAEMGADFQLIGEIVGHSTAEVTKIYRHANRAEKMKAAQLVGEAWGAALKPKPTGTLLQLED